MTHVTLDGLASARDASRRAYEWGRARVALVHAVTLCLVIGALSLAFVEARSLVWLPLTLVGWGLVEWRGVGVLQGGRVGALAGALALVLPMSVLRRCCKPGALAMMGGDCCSMPGACAWAGVGVGLLLVCFLPMRGVVGGNSGNRGEMRDVALGMVLGIGAVAPLKCSVLLAGEAAGLVGGLVAGVLAASGAKAVLQRWTVRA